MRKWSGVKGLKSKRSNDQDVKRCEFRQASTHIKIVLNFLSVKWALPNAQNKWNLLDLIADFRSPPKWKDLSGIKCQLIPDLDKASCTFGWWYLNT